MAPKTILSVLIALLLLAACSLPQTTPEILPTPTIFAIPTLPAVTPTFAVATLPLPTNAFVTAAPSSAVGSTLPVSTTAVAGGVTPVASSTFCADTQPAALISSLEKAVQTSDGTLLASLVSPVSGMEVRRYRDGRTVNYDQAHAKFLFESTFQVKWGAAPGSGLETEGSFHEVIIPAWLKVFNTTYTLACNQIQVGGTTYVAEWPYPGVNYYSLYYPGTSANGNMDWQTLLVGMQNVNGKYFIFSVMIFEWEI